MTQRVCVTGCGRPLRDVLLLCEQCLWEVERSLAETPSLLTQLTTTITRQDRMSSTTGGKRQADPDDGRNLPDGAKVQPLPFNLHASNLLDELRIVLHGWTRVLIEDCNQDPPPDTLRAMSRFLLARLDLIATHEAARDIHNEITTLAFNDPTGRNVGKAWRIIDRPPDMEFVGICVGCSERLYVIPGASIATCRWCNVDHDAEALRVSLRADLDGVLMTVAEIVHWGIRLRFIDDAKRTRNMLDQWVSRGRLTPRATNAKGRSTYPFGEVLQMAMTAQAERGTRRVERAG